MVGGGGEWKCTCRVEEEEEEEEATDEEETEEDEITPTIVPSTKVVPTGRSMRIGHAVSPVSPPAATGKEGTAGFSRHEGGPSSAPSSPFSRAPGLVSGVVSVLDIIPADILKFSKNKIRFEPRSGNEDEDRKLLLSLNIHEGDTITRIGESKLTQIHSGVDKKSNLEAFKSLTQGRPREPIRFTVENTSLAQSPRDVDIRLMSKADIAAGKVAKARADEEKRKRMKERRKIEGGIWEGGKKKTHRRKKPVNIRRRKPSRRTKKMKVMVGGGPETTPPPPRGEPPVRRKVNSSFGPARPRDSGAGVSEREPAEIMPSPRAAVVSSTPVKYPTGTIKTLKCTCKKQNDSPPTEEAIV
jgi:hypothetical protein